mmetsp:Transcript_16921/g.38814  ORF Transcript_16921/g.38814 Transcript_16921/m.38814 type:complete len:85 (+) Transcript_16921:3394-3648(+)
MTESKSPVTENYSVLYSIHSDILFLVFGVRVTYGMTGFGSCPSEETVRRMMPCRNKYQEEITIMAAQRAICQACQHPHTTLQFF